MPPTTWPLEEEEHVSRIEEFYDMICTATAEETLNLNMRRITQAQMDDKWPAAMVRHTQTGGVWMSQDEKLAYSCARYAPHFVVQIGVLMRVKFKFGTAGAYAVGSLPPVGAFRLL